MIDPKGVYGDPAFEAANVFYNPPDRDDLCPDPARSGASSDVSDVAVLVGDRTDELIADAIQSGILAPRC